MGRYMVVVSGPKMLEDIRQATDEQLSFRDAVAEVFRHFYRTHPTFLNISISALDITK